MRKGWLGFVNSQVSQEASHARAVESVRKYAEIRIPRRFKTIVTTSAGYPLDKTYYQTVKGMVGVMDIPGARRDHHHCQLSARRRAWEAANSRKPSASCAQVGPERFMNMLEGRDKATHRRVGDGDASSNPSGWATSSSIPRGSRTLTGSMCSWRRSLPVEAAVATAFELTETRRSPWFPRGPYVIPLYWWLDLSAVTPLFACRMPEKLHRPNLSTEE